MTQKILKNILKIFGIQYLLDLLTSKLKLPSALLLITVNLIPIIGVFIFNWNAYDIILLYWIENIVVGIYNIIRIITAQGSETYPFYIRIALAMFFTLHYSLFNLVHGMFIFTLILPHATLNLNTNSTGVLAFFIALMISHGYSLISNYFVKKEYKITNPEKQMSSPYTRVVVIHITIIVGMFFAMFLPTLIIIPFIILKTLTDLGFHIRAHASKQEDLSDYNINEGQINLIPK